MRNYPKFEKVIKNKKCSLNYKPKGRPFVEDLPRKRIRGGRPCRKRRPERGRCWGLGLGVGFGSDLCKRSGSFRGLYVFGCSSSGVPFSSCLRCVLSLLYLESLIHENMYPPLTAESLCDCPFSSNFELLSAPPRTSNYFCTVCLCQYFSPMETGNMTCKYGHSVVNITSFEHIHLLNDGKKVEQKILQKFYKFQ